MPRFIINADFEAADDEAASDVFVAMRAALVGMPHVKGKIRGPLPVDPAFPQDKEPNNFIAFCDGSYNNAHAIGGWAWRIRNLDGSIREGSGWVEPATNNIAELQAAIECLKQIPPNEPAIMFSDSRYVVDGLNMWVVGWMKRNWVTAAGTPVMNEALWRELWALYDCRICDVRWVKGHNGDPDNERCDTLASQAVLDRAHAKKAPPSGKTLPKKAKSKHKCSNPTSLLV